MAILRLTLAQRGLWFLTELDSAAAAAYNMVFSFEASARLDVGTLRQAVEILVRRHECLRSSVRPISGVPHLHVASAELPVDVPLRIELGGASLTHLARAESADPIDLTAAPPYRIITTVGAGASVGCVFTFSHLVFDEFSAATFFDELARTYNALRKNSAPELGRVPAGLDAIELRERTFLKGSRGREALDSAIERLHGTPSHLALPRRAPEVQRRIVYPAAMRTFELAGDEVVAVHAIARSARVTAGAVYLAAFQILLWRYSGQVDFGVSMPVANRAGAGLENCLGYLTNLAIVRTRVTPRQAVIEFVRRTQGELLEVLNTAEVPFPAVAQRLKRGGEEMQGPLTQIGFNYSRSDRRTLALEDCELRRVDFCPEYAKNELSLDLAESADSTRGWFLYDRDGFDADLIDRMVEHYHRLLRALPDNCHNRLTDLPWLTATERDRMLIGWNSAGARLPDAELVHCRFAEHAAKRGDSVALALDDRRLSYRELNAKANQLAHYLRGLDLPPDTAVGVCVERGFETVVALLAVLKAGYTYVPLDTEYPTARLARMLLDTAAPVLLTQASVQNKLPAVGTRTVALDTDRELIDRQPTANPPNKSLPEHGAYCVYTSGSTGGSKGVVISHDSLAQRIAACVAAYELSSCDRSLQFASTSFDVAIEQVLAPLCSGGAIVLRPQSVWSPDQVVDAIRTHAVTVADVPTAYWHAYAATAHPLQGLPLRLLIIGGEAASAASLPLEPLPFRLINAYGPTEATITSCLHEVRLPSPSPAAGHVPIGRPLAGTRIHILDTALQPVPVGVAGEIHIGGAGLARGYLNRPELTAENFIPDPFGAPGSRLYRTGDLGRYAADGTIEFLGRLDDQVKIRGLRIELGEIESALLRCGGVQRAVVLARSDDDGEKRLVGYVVAEEPGGISLDMLREELRQTLPAYMVPAAWVLLEALPMNQSGKIDRSALPPPEWAHPATTVEYVAPATATERVLAEIWAEVLKLERVGADDNFFSLGGHSLLATQVIARIGSRLAAHVQLRLIFDSPTVSLLGAQVDRLLGQKSAVAAMQTPIKRQCRKGRDA